MKRLVWFLLIGSAFAQQINTDLIPATSGLNLGHSNQRWNGFFQNVDILGTCTINGSPCQTVANSAQIGAGTPGQIPIYNGSISIKPDPNLDDGNTTPGVFTFSVPIATPQVNLTGTGGLASVGPGGTLPTPGPGNGLIGIGPGAIPVINPNNTGVFAIPYITINGTPLANTANNTNFSNTAPTAPTNGLNLSWQFSGQNISAAIVGDGNAAHALCGTGVFGVCTAGGATAISGLTAATGANAPANGNNPQTWNWAQTTNSQSGMTFGESSAATGGTLTSAIANQAEVTVSAASGSTATPLSVVQGSVTGTTAFPAAQFQMTWNNAGLTGEGVLISVTDTASTVNSAPFDIQKGAASVFKVDKFGDVAIPNLSAFGGNTAAANITFCGGTALNQACTSNTNGTVGGAIFQGSDNSSTGSSAKSGYAILRNGFLSAANPNSAALELAVQVGSGALKGSAIANVGDALCMSTTADTLTDCPLGATNIVGIATNTSNPIGYVMYGTTLVKLDGAIVALGDHICGPPSSTGTIGLNHDNGASLCPSGQNIGIALADVGSFTQMSGASTASTAMSTTLVKVALHIGD